MPGAPTPVEISPRAVLAVVGIGTLLAALSGSAVSLALPAVGRDLALSVETSRWMVQGFLLAVGVLLLPAGRLSDLLGHRRIYLGGFLLFGVTALGCGLAPSFGWLILFRVLQGVGAAMAMATGPALLTTTVPPSQRGRALGLLATATYLGLTAGPPVGGLIVAELGWRWTFHLMIPISALVLLLGLRFLPRRPTRSLQGFDRAGATTLALGLPLVLVALSEGPRWGWTHWAIGGAGLAGLALLGLFVRTELHRDAPLIDLALFRSRVFTGAVVSAVANYVALFVVILLLPFFLEEGLRLSSARSGLLLAVQAVMMALVSSPAGWLSDRIGSRGLAVAGMLLLAVGLGGLALRCESCGQLGVAVWLAVMGLGTGIFISPNSSALMGAAPRDQQGVAGSVLGEARVLGMLLGVALGSAVFHAAGGRTGAAWSPVEFAALRQALWTGAGVAVLAAVAAGLRGDGTTKLAERS